METQIPLFDIHSPWRPPTELIDFSSAPMLGIDTETRDEKLRILGPGYTRGDGYIVGIGISDGHRSAYYPIRHAGGDNLSEEIVLPYIREMLSHDREYIFAKATYDLGWLKYHGINVNGKIRDIQVAEGLLDETRLSYSLDSLAFDYLGERKEEALLEQAAENYRSANQRNGGRGKKAFDKKKDLWRLPARYVGPYGAADPRQTLEIYKKQIPKLREEGLWKVWELECKITPICHEMSMAGIRVDLNEADKLNEKLKKQARILEKECEGVDLWSVSNVCQLLQKKGIETPKTEKGNDSAPKAFLEGVKHPIAKAVIQARQIDRLRGPFLEKNILNNNVKGRIHSQFLQTTREEGGTRSGRFSCQGPNMQQVPKRSDIGKLLRALYIAEDNYLWCKCDYSSQEPRLQVHYGLILGFQGSLEALRYFNEGKKLYNLIVDATGCTYAMSKDILLGLSYGMGLKRLAATLGMSMQEAEEIVLTPLRLKVPFIFELAKRLKNKANKSGVIKTIYGRKARFDWWAPQYDPNAKDQLPPIKGFDKAQEVYRNTPLQRAFLNKSLNCLIQGSAADQTKVAMVDLWEAGIKTRLPVHDELNDPACPNHKQANLMKEIMENAIKLKIPTVGDLDVGPTWC